MGAEGVLAAQRPGMARDREAPGLGLESAYTLGLVQRHPVTVRDEPESNRAVSEAAGPVKLKTQRHKREVAEEALMLYFAQSRQLRITRIGTVVPECPPPAAAVAYLDQASVTVWGLMFTGISHEKGARRKPGCGSVHNSGISGLGLRRQRSARYGEDVRIGRRGTGLGCAGYAFSGRPSNGAKVFRAVLP